MPKPIIKTHPGLFKKGKSGNPGGRPKTKLLSLLAEHLQALDEKTGKPNEEVIAQRLIEDAKSNIFATRKWATQILLDQVLGRPKERTDDAGAEEEQLQLPRYMIAVLKQLATQPPTPVEVKVEQIEPTE